MDQYIFSYGSLALKEVAEKTGQTLSFVPAVLRGYQRNFRVRVPGSGFTAAGIEAKKEAETRGVLVQVPEAELAKFDHRESRYERIRIAAALLKSIDGSAIPQGDYYLYVPRDPQPPTEAFPLSQSYIDVLLSPFLSLETEKAVQLVRSMTDFDRPWVNDRELPLYSRYPAGLDTEAIDELLRLAIPEALEKRRAQEVHIRPELVTAIMATIRFFDLFDFPLVAEEVKDYLYKYPHPLHIKELKATLDHLIKAGKLSEIKGYYVLAGREPIVEIRKTRRFIAEKFWNRTKLYGQYMRSVPFTRMIAVCNNLAYDNPSEQSDIDLFVVVERGRMWLSRFLITMILHFFGVRRYGDKVAGRFCLSFFVTTDTMSMKEFALSEEDPYLAYWTKNLRPVFGSRVYADFQEKNRFWLSDYSLSFNESWKKHMYHYEDTRMKRIFEWLLGGRLGNLMEAALKATLKKRTLKSAQKLGSQSNVIVTDEILKFHNHDRRQEYYDRWRGMKK